MKSKLMNLLSCVLILSFAAACGKNSSNGSSANNFLPSGSNTLQASGDQAQANLKAWYNSSSEGGYPSLAYPVRQVTRSTTTFSTSNNCNQQSLNAWGINLLNLNLCLNATSGGATSNSTENVTLSSTGSKLVNPKLAEALAGIMSPGAGGLTLVNISQQPSPASSGSAFVIQYVDSAQKPHVFVIDSGINSALNPVHSIDGAAGKEVKLISIYPSN